MSNKNCYQTRELAEEALIQNHARNHHFKNAGPINVYLCDDCGNYHFTSKGSVNKRLLDADIQKRIESERLSTYWEQKLR